MDFSELKRLAEEKVNPRALSEDCQVFFLYSIDASSRLINVMKKMLLIKNQ
ncbi:hypothetical protein SAMN02982927_01446 [Sporolactobacillus nakayamae]|uniref:HEPN domain-containing protein n=1 Tax=Sporolactobacillus nakayamae TaxID=269670 RepID=A0A1I2R171_9BACL|nr:hypothetical protein SAMN02982927_01446 [Sporolactobacillus nakayamae]